MGITVQDAVKQMQNWIGADKRTIIDLYNSHSPLAMGYAVKYTDAWCDATISALFIKLGATDIIGGTECGVERHIALFKKAGIWEEDGTVTPEPGWIICYNWDDSTQPNDGFADHIGLVESVNGNNISLIEGNYNDAVRRRTIPVGWGYIRGYAKPKYETSGSAAAEPAASAGPLNGIDIASYQSTLSPGAIPGDFIIIKATQGTGYINPTFAAQADATLKAGKALGLYHYANGSGVIAEVDFFLQTVSAYIGKAFLYLDWEHIPNGGPNAQFQNPAYAKLFMDEVKKRTGQTMFVYGSKDSCFNAMDWSAVKNAGYPCWGAQYANNNQQNGYNRSPWQSSRPWGAWGQDVSIFQYTSALRLSGYSGNLDGDIAYISLDRLKAYAKGDAVSEVVSEPTSETLNRAQLLQMVADTMDNVYGIGDTRKAKLGKYYDQVMEVINYVDKTAVDQLAADVWAGKFGNDPIRSKILGAKTESVRAAVNRKSSGMKTASEVAKEIVDGVGGWGNDPDRTKKLRAAGYDSVVVQKEVNRLLGVA